jgi:hypothetical protein
LLNRFIDARKLPTAQVDNLGVPSTMNVADKLDLIDHNARCLTPSITRDMGNGRGAYSSVADHVDGAVLAFRARGIRLSS